ncbi:MAG: tetratricopeptide repeat protein, partial [Ectothiorhodospiraceae bacterium]
ALLAGCAQMPAQRGQQSLAAGEAQPRDAHEELLYHLMVAELAGGRGDLVRASDEYAVAARNSDDPRLAERATRVALYADRSDLAAEMAARWLKLSPDSVDAHRALGLLYLRRGNVDKATEHFIDAVPKQAMARDQSLARLGALLSQESDIGAALEVVTSVAAAYPESRTAHYAVAQVALEAQKPDRAVAALDEALKLDPSWRAAHMLRIEALLADDRSEEALASLRTLLEDSPEDYDLRLQYARTLVNLSRTDQALAQFEQLLKRRPDDSRVLYAAGLLALEANRLDKAEDWFNRLLALDERKDAARYYLGRIAEDKGNYDEAIDLYSRAGGSYREDAQLRIAIALASSGELNKARERLHQLRQNNPNVAVRSYAVEGEILRSSGALGESIDVYTQGLSENPGNVDLLYGRALTYVGADRIAEGEKDLRAILKKQPDNVQALNALGYTLADRTQRYDEAQSLIHRAYANSPDDPAIVDSMGWVAYRMGRLEEAVEFLRRAYELSGEAEIAAHLGEVLWKLDRRKEARSVWNEALQDSPDSSVLRETVERLTK